jgi:hypothetical protein
MFWSAVLMCCAAGRWASGAKGLPQIVSYCIEEKLSRRPKGSLRSSSFLFTIKNWYNNIEERSEKAFENKKMANKCCVEYFLFFKRKWKKKKHFSIYLQIYNRQFSSIERNQQGFPHHTVSYLCIETLSCI